MTLTEKLIYLEEGIRQLKNQIIETKLCLSSKQKLELELDLDVIQSQIDSWRWHLTL